MKYFKIIDRPYNSEADFAYRCDDGYYITDKGTCISPADDNYVFEEITAEEYEVETNESN
jgi:hypothetical protein